MWPDLIGLLNNKEKLVKQNKLGTKIPNLFRSVVDSTYLLCGLLSFTQLTRLSALWISLSFLFSFATNTGRIRRQGDLGFLPPPSDAVIWKSFTDFLALCPKMRSNTTAGGDRARIGGKKE